MRVTYVSDVPFTGCRVFEFQVDSVDDAGMVLGRNVGGDIPVGTTFTAIHRTRYRDDGGKFWSEGAVVVGRVALTVREVYFWRRRIDVIPGGHSAGLAVSGDGLEVLVGALYGLPRNEFLSLVADE